AQYDAAGAACLNRDFLHRGCSEYGEIAALARAGQIAACRAAALALPGGAIDAAKAFLAIAVDVITVAVTSLLAGSDEGGVQRGCWPAGGNADVAVTTVIIVRAVFVPFRAHEVGQDVAIAPAVAAALLPAVVIQCMTADVHHAVDRRRAAECTAARRIHLALVQTRLWLGMIVPVEVLRVDRVTHARRHVDHPGVGARAGFQQKHARTGVVAQAVGEHTTGGTGADNNVIVSVIHLCHEWEWVPISRIRRRRRPAGWHRW